MDHHCISCENNLCTRRVPIFADLTDAEQLEIVNLIQHKVFDKGQAVYHEGDPSDQLLIVSHGAIRLFKNTIEGKEQNLDILLAGDLTGELDLLGDSTYSHEAVAQEKTLLCVISQDKIKELILKNPVIGLKIMRAMNQKLANLRGLVQSLATNEGMPRLVHLLLQLYDQKQDQKRDQKQDKGLLRLNLSREDLANFTGLTRETVSRKLTQLQDEGLIQINKVREIEILDIEALRRYSA